LAIMVFSMVVDGAKRFIQKLLGSSVNMIKKCLKLLRHHMIKTGAFSNFGSALVVFEKRRI